MDVSSIFKRSTKIHINWCLSQTLFNEYNRYLLNAGANVHASTQTGDTALTYACENGHTDVADLLLRAGAELEHESEGGRTPLMKACRAGHLCTVQFLVGKVTYPFSKVVPFEDKPQLETSAGTSEVHLDDHLPVVMYYYN